ncbi:carboxy terminal-processing peptidase [Paraflavitalea speifideaquila]|uniref:carboxy terminal-processing peptidase n=1 Tax=Paraflavitalea speifideaquila TaxID=3076558 RepID=UPI0028EBDCDC|nr:carboxy terminal-processing peptidase [Paraflavitalea speifideiaquila]
MGRNKKAEYNRWKYGLDLAPIKKASDDRIKSSDAFTKIKTNAEWLARQNDKITPLNLKKFQEEQRQIKAVGKQIDSINKSAKELDVEAMAEDLKKFEYDTGKSERFKQWIKSLRNNDIYLGEAVNVINDMIVQKNLVYNANGAGRKN